MRRTVVAALNEANIQWIREAILSRSAAAGFDSVPVSLLGTEAFRLETKMNCLQLINMSRHMVRGHGLMGCQSICLQFQCARVTPPPTHTPPPTPQAPVETKL